MRHYTSGTLIIDDVAGTIEFETNQGERKLRVIGLAQIPANSDGVFEVTVADIVPQNEVGVCRSRTRG